MKRCGVAASTLKRRSQSGRLITSAILNRPRILGVLGGAVSNACENILMDIGREIRAIDRENLRIPLAKRENMVYNDFNVVKRESDTSEGAMKMELTYQRQGDYLFPNLEIESSVTEPSAGSGCSGRPI